MNDLISRAEAIEAIELVDWYHQNSNKDMVHGANSDEHQAWYKADDVYKALEAVPSADRPKDGDLISRAEAAEMFEAMLKTVTDQKIKIGISRSWQQIKDLPSADRPKGEWIPCEERLPGEKKAVLICDSRGNRFVGKLVLTDYGYKWSARLFRVWIDIEDGDVWMPLPKPYGERSEE